MRAVNMQMGHRARNATFRMKQERSNEKHQQSQEEHMPKAKHYALGLWLHSYAIIYDFLIRRVNIFATRNDAALLFTAPHYFRRLARPFIYLIYEIISTCF